LDCDKSKKSLKTGLIDILSNFLYQLQLSSKYKNGFIANHLGFFYKPTIFFLVT